MKQKWLDVVLHFSGIISAYKSKLVNASGVKIVAIGVWVLILEVINFLISLPAYIFISPNSIDLEHKEAVSGYRLRRIVSLSVVLSVLSIWLIKIGITALIGIGIFSHGGHKAKADTVAWDFNNPVAYLYDATKIQVTNGMAILKASSLPLTETTPDIAISLPPTTGAVEANANTVPTQDSTETTASANTTTQTTAGVDVNTGSAPVETSPLAPVIETIEVSTTSTSAGTPAPSVVEPPAAPTPTPPTVTPPVAPPVSGDGLLNFDNTLIKTAHAESQVCSATIQPLIPLVPLNLQSWTGFSDAVTGGTVAYQLSEDSGLSWQYWDGSAWANAGTDAYNDAITINEHMSSFPHTTGSILFRAKMTGDCLTDVELLNIDVTYDHIPPVLSEVVTNTYTLIAPTGVTS